MHKQAVIIFVLTIILSLSLFTSCADTDTLQNAEATNSEILEKMLYWGDVNCCNMSSEQASAYAQLISDGLAGKFKGFYGYGGPVKDGYVYWDKPYTIDGYCGEYDTDRANATLADLAGDGNPFLILKSSLVDEGSFEIFGWKNGEVSRVYGAEDYHGREYSYIAVNSKTKKAEIIEGGNSSFYSKAYVKYSFCEGDAELVYHEELEMEPLNSEETEFIFHVTRNGIETIYTQEEYITYIDSSPENTAEDNSSEVFPSDIYCPLAKMKEYLGEYALCKNKSK